MQIQPVIWPDATPATLLGFNEYSLPSTSPVLTFVNFVVIVSVFSVISVA